MVSGAQTDGPDGLDHAGLLAARAVDVEDNIGGEVEVVASVVLGLGLGLGLVYDV